MSQYSLFMAVFATMIISACNLPGSALVDIFGTSITVGTFLFPLTFILFDLNTCFYGASSTKKIILYIVYSQISLFFITFGIGYVTNTADYIMPLRVITGSVLGFFLSSLFDTYMFARLNTYMKDSKIWLSCNVSSIIGQMVDTTVFSFVAFYGLLSQSYIWKSAAVIFLIKVISGIILTPMLYLIKTKIESSKN